MAEAEMGGALLFYRGLTLADFFRSYEIFVNGESVGRLRRRSELRVERSAGTYTCRAVISWTGSPTVEAEVKPGQTTKLHVLPGDQGSPMERALSDAEYLRIVFGV
jgi:hypothetical protein